MKICKDCCSAINKAARVCPECGSRQGIRRFLTTLNFSLGIIVAIIAIVTFLWRDVPFIPQPLITPENEKGYVSISEVAFENYRLSAVISNTSDAKIEAPTSIRCTFGKGSISNEAARRELEGIKLPLDIKLQQMTGELDRGRENKSIRVGPDETATLLYHVTFGNTNFDSLTRANSPVSSVVNWPAAVDDTNEKYFACLFPGTGYLSENGRELFSLQTSRGAANSINLYRCGMIIWLTNPGRMQDDVGRC